MKQHNNVVNVGVALQSTLENALTQIAYNRAYRDVIGAKKTLNTSIEKGYVFMKTPTVSNMTIS